jgi:ankyrin repeat protein
MLACKIGSKETVELLLKYGANIMATNNLGDTAMNFAQKSGNQDVIMLCI